jgi:peptidoglycan hydrolase CwlO-like protein
MYAIKESKLTDLEKLEDKFDDIIQDLSEKIDELEYVNDRQASEIGDLQSDSIIADCKIEELQQEVSSLETRLDNMED